MINWNEFAAEVHQNAVDHGWWDEKRSFGEVVALCHSELSEALEEYRCKRPLVYVLDIDELFYETDLQKGVAVELADCVIRILDWLGKEKADIPELFAKAHRLGPDYSDAVSFGEFISSLHHALSGAWGSARAVGFAFSNLKMASVILLIMCWAAASNVDIEEILRIKHEYNKTRPYRHGGKAL